MLFNEACKIGINVISGKLELMAKSISRDEGCYLTRRETHREYATIHSFFSCIYSNFTSLLCFSTSLMTSFISRIYGVIFPVSVLGVRLLHLFEQLKDTSVPFQRALPQLDGIPMVNPWVYCFSHQFVLSCA